MDAKHLIEQILADSDVRFPALPLALVRVTEALNKPDYTTQDLADAITNPSIVVRVLQVANSPAMRTSSTVATVQAAISVLGSTLVRNIVVCVSMRDLFSCRDLSLAKVVDDSWHHSVEIASISAVMAKRYKLKRDVALTAGLLHDIGMLPIVSYFDHVGAPFDPAMMEAKSALGSALLKRWSFPQEISEATEACSQLPRAGGLRYFDLVSAAHFLFDQMPERLQLIGMTHEAFDELVSSEERVALRDSLL